MPDTFTNAHRVEVTPLAARYRLPAAYPFRFFADIGEPIVWKWPDRQIFGARATYCTSILSSRVRSQVNFRSRRAGHHLKTAKALDLTVPPTLLTRW